MTGSFAWFWAALAVSLATHAYLWKRLVHDSSPGPHARRATIVLLAVGAAALPCGMLQLLCMRLTPRALAAPVMWLAFTWMGVALLLFAALVVGDVARIGLRAIRFARRAPPAIDPVSRRTALARGIGAAAAGFAAVTGGVAVRGALREFAIVRVQVLLARMTPRATPYRIVQISDLHVGPTIGLGDVARVVAAVAGLAPDLVVITGDLVDGSVAQLGPLLRPLGSIRAPDGVFFVTGNHEYLSLAEPWVRYLPTLGIRVLRNERLSIGGEHGFDLAGVDDESARTSGEPGHGTNVASAMRDRNPTRAVVLLAHQPKTIDSAAAHGVDLQLSGHTHGGQMWPLRWLAKLDQPYIAGLHRHGDTWIYVSSGTGYWGPPMRLGTRAEITVVEISGPRTSGT